MAQKLYLPDAFAENRFKKTNQMLSRPKGWLIADSWNNEAYPMDLFEIDTMKFNTEKLATWFHKTYGGSTRDLFLPWHWIMDLVNNKPFVIQTRPFFYKSNIPGFKNHFTILVIGNGDIDIYPGAFYKQMAHMLINPVKQLPGIRVNNSKENFTFQIGKNFDRNKLLKEMQ
jgi:hypothetical protein